MNKDLLKLHKSWKTVFSTDDLASFFWMEYSKIKHKISYYSKTWDLIRIYHGIYVLNKNYNPLELANKILRPSYVSLDTILRQEGIIFQYSEEIKVISYKTMKLEINNHIIDFHFLKEGVRNSSEWIIHTGNISIATKERAFLDSIYLYKDIHFDNLRPLDWKKCFKLVEIYNSPILKKRLNSYYNDYVKHK